MSQAGDSWQYTSMNYTVYTMYSPTSCGNVDTTTVRLLEMTAATFGHNCPLPHYLPDALLTWLQGERLAVQSGLCLTGHDYFLVATPFEEKCTACENYDCSTQPFIMIHKCPQPAIFSHCRVNHRYIGIENWVKDRRGRTNLQGTIRWDNPLCVTLWVNLPCNSSKR